MSTMFDKAGCRLVRQDIQEALAAVAEKHGISIHAGAGSYTRDHSNFSLKLEMATKGEGGEVNTPERRAFIKLAHIYGLEPEDLGATILQGGETYVITGLNTRAPKFPIQAERKRDGAGFKFPPEVAKAGMRRHKEVTT